MKEPFRWGQYAIRVSPIFFIQFPLNWQFWHQHNVFLMGALKHFAGVVSEPIIVVHTGWPKKTSRTLRNYNGSYTLWGEISFSTFVDQYVLLLTYKFQ